MGVGKTNSIPKINIIMSKKFVISILVFVLFVFSCGSVHIWMYVCKFACVCKWGQHLEKFAYYNDEPHSVQDIAKTTSTLCGAHALERMGEMKSQKIQKGGLFDSVEEKGVLVKNVEQGWGFRSYFKHWAEKGTYDTTQCSYCLQKKLCNI